MVEWHHWLDGHEFEQALEVGDGQGRPACCSAWGCKESDMTEQLNWKENFNFFWDKVFANTSSPSLTLSRNVVPFVPKKF